MKTLNLLELLWRHIFQRAYGKIWSYLVIFWRVSETLTIVKYLNEVLVAVDRIYCISIDEYRYNDNILYWFAVRVITVYKMSIVFTSPSGPTAGSDHLKTMLIYFNVLTSNGTFRSSWEFRR